MTGRRGERFETESRSETVPPGEPAFWGTETGGELVDRNPGGDGHRGFVYLPVGERFGWGTGCVRLSSS
jgi:hypothetical protein